MNMRGGRGLPTGVVAAVIAGASACHRAPPPVMTSAPPSVPQQEISAPARRQPPQSPLPQVASDTATEERVSIDTHGREIDVRDALQFLAERGGLTLVYSPEINKKIRLRLNDVPVSRALQVVLSLAGLTLETIDGSQKPYGSTAVVFYQLPVNVDSLSVDAIMKRFGVGRAVAEMIVDARTRKP